MSTTAVQNIASIPGNHEMQPSQRYLVTWFRKRRREALVDKRSPIVNLTSWGDINLFSRKVLSWIRGQFFPYERQPQNESVKRGALVRLLPASHIHEQLSWWRSNWDFEKSSKSEMSFLFWNPHRKNGLMCDMNTKMCWGGPPFRNTRWIWESHNSLLLEYLILFSCLLVVSQLFLFILSRVDVPRRALAISNSVEERIHSRD